MTDQSKKEPNVITGLINWWNSATSVSISELKAADIVVRLGPDQVKVDPDTKKPDSTLFYVGKEGTGAIKRISDREFEEVNPKLIKLVDLATLSPNGIERERQAATIQGARVIMDNFSILAEPRGPLPFNAEKPETAKASSLTQIGALLWNIRADIYSGAAPDRVHDGNPVYDTPQSKAEKQGVAARLPAVDEAFVRVDRAIRLPTYASDLSKDLAVVTMDDKQKAALQRVLEGSGVDTLMQERPQGRLDKRFP